MNWWCWRCYWQLLSLSAQCYWILMWMLKSERLCEMLQHAVFCCNLLCFTVICCVLLWSAVFCCNKRHLRHSDDSVGPHTHNIILSTESVCCRHIPHPTQVSAILVEKRQTVYFAITQQWQHTTHNNQQFNLFSISADHCTVSVPNWSVNAKILMVVLNSDYKHKIHGLVEIFHFSKRKLCPWMSTS